jgi:probable HAF family extracellular repeat protein
MTRVRFTYISRVAIVATLAITTHLAAQVKYTVTDLGTLGGTFSQANTINNRGQVVGTSNLQGDEVAHAFFWEDGKITDLGTLGGPISVGAGVNDSGEAVVGADTNIFGGLKNTICATEAICRMFIWKNGLEVPDLGTLPGGTDAGIFSIVAFGAGTSLINNRHQAAGTADLPRIDPNNPPFAISHAFLWRKGVVHDLGTLDDGNNSDANAINDKGQIAGVSETTPVPDPELNFPPVHGFLWDHGVMTDLHTLGGKLSWALGINNRGQIAGVSTLPGDFLVEAFLWDNGVLTDLGTLPDDNQSAANAVSNQDDEDALAEKKEAKTIVVGVSAGHDMLRAVLWEDGVITDLNDQIPADSGWQLQWAQSINSRGQIVGFGIHKDQTRAFLLTPTGDKADAPERSATPKGGITKAGMLRTMPKNLRPRRRFDLIQQLTKAK